MPEPSSSTLACATVAVRRSVAVHRTAAIAVAALAMLVGIGALAGGQGAVAETIHGSPGGFTVHPNITDSHCNRGRGLEWAAELGENPVVASGTLADGSTLIAVSSGGPPNKPTVVLYSVSPACTANLAFGKAGTVRLGPTQRESKDPLPGGALGGLQIDVVAAASGGGAFIAGSYGGNWIVGKVTPQGQPDVSFGHKGWSVLRFGGEVASVVQQPSGIIALAATNGGGGCCTTNWMATLSSTGQRESEFGNGGREVLPTGEDSGPAPLVLEPNGDVLAPVDYGNMGCWGMSLQMLEPAGRPVPLFQQRLSSFWKALHFGAFTGSVYADGAGFTIIGTGQAPCYASKPAASVTGVIAHFSTDGKQIGQTIRFASTQFGSLYASQDGNDTLIAASAYANSTRLTLDLLRPNGSLDGAFATGGVAELRTPWTGMGAALQTQLSISEAGPDTIVIVAQDAGNQLQLTRLDV